MGINWKGALAGLGNGVSQMAQVQISEEVTRQREARMAQYQQAQVADERQYQGQVRADERAHEMEVMGLQTEAEREAAIAQRQQEVADAELDHQRGQDDIRLRAEIDPQASKIDIKTGDTETYAQRRGLKTQEGMAEADVEMVSSVKKAAQSVSKMNDVLGALESLQNDENFKTGKTPDMVAQIGSYFGTDAGAMRQMVEGSVAPMVLDLMAQQKGPQTDADRAQFEKIMPTFDKDPKAFSLMMGYLRKYTRRATENYEALKKYEDTDYYINTGSYGKFQMPNIVDKRETEKSQDNIDAVDDPLGLFD